MATGNLSRPQPPPKSEADDLYRRLHLSQARLWGIVEIHRKFQEGNEGAMHGLLADDLEREILTLDEVCSFLGRQSTKKAVA